MVGEQARLGILSGREAAESANRHLLSRSVGNDMFVAVEIDDVQVQKGDVLVQCSDGLHGPVPDVGHRERSLCKINICPRRRRD